MNPAQRGTVDMSGLNGIPQDAAHRSGSLTTVRPTSGSTRSPSPASPRPAVSADCEARHSEGGRRTMRGRTVLALGHAYEAASCASVKYEGRANRHGGRAIRLTHDRPVRSTASEIPTCTDGVMQSAAAPLR
jgi:hypothetical protein